MHSWPMQMSVQPSLNVSILDLRSVSPGMHPWDAAAISRHEDWREKVPPDSFGIQSKYMALPFITKAIVSTDNDYCRKEQYTKWHQPTSMLCLQPTSGNTWLCLIWKARIHNSWKTVHKCYDWASRESIAESMNFGSRGSQHHHMNKQCSPCRGGLLCTSQGVARRVTKRRANSVKENWNDEVKDTLH